MTHAVASMNVDASLPNLARMDCQTALDAGFHGGESSSILEPRLSSTTEDESEYKPASRPISGLPSHNRPPHLRFPSHPNAFMKWHYLMVQTISLAYKQASAAAVGRGEGDIEVHPATVAKWKAPDFDIISLEPLATCQKPPSGLRTAVLAFTEQRTWLAENAIQGRMPLAIVSALATTVPVRLAARIGAIEPGGVALAPGAAPAALAWPSAGNPFRMARTIATLFCSILREARNANVVYADQPGIVGGLGLLAGHALGKPLVVNVVGDANESVHPSVIPGAKGRVAHAIFPRLQRWACANATYVNYVTSSVLQKRYPATQARRTFASTTASALGPARPRSFPHNQVSVVTVASLERPYKGVAELIDAIRICRGNGLEVRLTVIGEGRLRPELEAHAMAVVPGIVAFTGHLYRQDLYEELGRHDVFALASWTEGLPRALLEAMADGLPAVATGIGGVPELIEPERIAPVRDPSGFADRLAHLLSNKDAWSTTIAYNFKVSGELLRCTNNSLDDFIKAIAALADLPRGEA